MIKRITAHFTPKQYLVEMLLGLTALFGLYLIIAWSGYSPLDSSWSVSSSQPETINKAGKLGAWFIDLFFALFGHIGNIMPFVLFIAPIYFIRTKRRDSLTWTRLFLRLFGFSLLLCGLTALAALLLSNSLYYLAGGVLGGSLVVSFFPLIGKFGILLSGFILSVVGFIVCSGASLIRLLVKFYYWLTMKNEEPATETEEQPLAEENEFVEPPEEIKIPQSAVFQTEEKNDSAEEVDLVDVNRFIQISGLNNEKPTEQVTQSVLQQTPIHSEPLHENITADAFSGYGVDQIDDLPNVSIAVMDVTAHNQNFAPTAPLPHTQVQQQAQQSAVDFSRESDYTFERDEMPIPTVSIPPVQSVAPDFDASASITVRLNETESLTKEADDAEMTELARQFEEQQKQRFAEMEQRAKAMDAEDALNVILNKEESAVEISPTITAAPDYKPYGNSLIHPALQQKAVSKAKPTTPLPSLDLLEHRPTQAQDITQEEIIETSQRIEQQLRNFNVKATVKDVLVGPVVTRYELELQPGVKASKVTGIDTDLARALMFRSIRVAEVIPGKPYIGIETPNTHRQTVPLRDVLDSDEFRQSKSLLSMALGKDISGKPVVVDLAKMPHLLVAGSTGSGKSVGVNTMILSLLFRVKPEEVKFIMIDPKVVELSIYNDIPHLLTEVVTDMKKAANALRWCVDEMERRYQLLSALRVRNIEGYNEKIDEYNAMGMPIPNPIWRPGDTMDALPPALEKLSYIVVIVDEFADLMMVAGKQIEELIARLAQKARAIGIHLILATQRPSVDVITGLIKANIPSRIAFTVASKIDSRTILDQGGAEALLGRGDMLYSGQGSSDLIRVHGAFMSDDEVARIADDWRARGKPNYIDGILDGAEEEESADGERGADDGELDDLFDQVMEFVLSTGTTSVSSIQRRFRVGFNRAARIMDQMEEQGIVSAQQNGKREILARRPDY
ncbi:FtsK/SpoIIIE family DNA translocase [Caviibacterium pharyngocola]|uniref:DNA translocase FtsK n=1 Tax=Caviibacterium pharyngocola TaxID=28159 RepID=A0A2M8RWR9_9PAST|nr:DNA translocase FtsK 4TM domain-containing protein [Caviibacterium pharyngocola]PJG83311.1 cell division protein FtsK [Caviibacterium pharyngocola]